MNFDYPDSDLNDPLIDEELDFLEQFFSGNAVCDDAMDAVMLHGFLTSGYQELAKRDYTVEQRRSFVLQLAAAALNIHRYGCEERHKLMEQGARPGMIPAVACPKHRTTRHVGRGAAQPGHGSKDLFLVDSLGRVTDEAIHSLALSPLATRITREGISVDVHIYHADNSGHEGWVLEIVDASGTSTVWDDLFSTDGAALAEALDTISTRGFASVTGDITAPVSKHGALLHARRGELCVARTDARPAMPCGVLRKIRPMTRTGNVSRDAAYI